MPLPTRLEMIRTLSNAQAAAVLEIYQRKIEAATPDPVDAVSRRALDNMLGAALTEVLL